MRNGQHLWSSPPSLIAKFCVEIVTKNTKIIPSEKIKSERLKEREIACSGVLEFPTAENNYFMYVLEIKVK
jgi:hypothetical protein